MNPLSRMVALALTTGALLIGSALPAAAQDFPGTCAIAPESLVVATLGPSAHSLGGISGPGSDVCTVSVDGSKIAILHISAFEGDDTSGGFGGAPGAMPPEMLGTITKIDGLGDSAMLAANGSGYILVVKRASDVFTFSSDSLTDGQTKLVALATAVVANTAQ